MVQVSESIHATYTVDPEECVSLTDNSEKMDF